MSSKHTSTEDIAFGINFAIVVVALLILGRAIVNHDADYLSGVATVLFVQSFLASLLYLAKRP